MSDTVRPPVTLLVVAFLLALVGVVSALLIGGSLLGYLFGMIGTVLVMTCLLLDRTRQANPNYDFGITWFRKMVALTYWAATIATLTHIVRYAYEVAVN